MAVYISLINIIASDPEVEMTKEVDVEVCKTQLFKRVLRLLYTLKLSRNLYRLQQFINEEIKKLQDADLIQESSSPCRSPILIVLKKTDESLKPQYRFCINFRSIQKCTVKESYTLPRI